MARSGYRVVMLLVAWLSIGWQGDALAQTGGKPAVRHIGSAQSTPAPIAGLPALSPQDQREMDRDEPLSQFRQFPADVRRLMQRETYEYDYCRGGPGRDGPEGLMAMHGCNGAHRVRIALEKRGWCWGGGWVAADDHWLKCRSLPGYQPGMIAGDGYPFSAKDFAEAIAERKADAIADARRRAAAKPR